MEGTSVRQERERGQGCTWGVGPAYNLALWTTRAKTETAAAAKWNGPERKVAG
jgi:hypothetical protein